MKINPLRLHRSAILAQPEARSSTISSVIPGIVLAGGKSSRMGRCKALLPIATGETFLSRVIGTLKQGEVDDILVVLGHEPDPVIRELERYGTAVRAIVNPDYESGQLSSMILGLSLVDRPGVLAALVTLVDVPLVTAATVRAVVERYRRTRAPIVRPVHGPRHGHPMVLDRSLFPALRMADLSVGPKPVLQRYVSEAGDVEVDDEGAFQDVDTPEEYARLLSTVGSHSPEPPQD
jgi:molybdenum cofactor cytidylyltransferase